MRLDGAKTYAVESGMDGNYSINGISSGNYKLTPIKDNEVNSITAYDASLVLQSTVSKLELTEHQKLAADVNNSSNAVNNDDGVTSMDASYILEKAISSFETPFEGQESYWKFTPKEREYVNLNLDQLSQDFTAVLVGDVSGNWGASGTSSVQSTTDNQYIVRLGDETQTEGELRRTVTISHDRPEIYGAMVTITYDQSILTSNIDAATLGIEKTSLTENCIMAVNMDTPGVIKIGIAGSKPITDTGSLVNISFKGETGKLLSKSVELKQVMINETYLKLDDVANSDDCFIATAAYNTKFAPAVKLLRSFRDRILLKNQLGTNFVKYYYKNSPPIADYISDKPILKGLVRIILLPVITVAYCLLHPVVIAIAVLFFGYRVWKRRYSKKLLH
jgi:hypothetical protein